MVAFVALVAFVAFVAVAALPPMLSAVAVPVKLVATPADGVPKSPPAYKRVAEASGSVKVFSAVVGPENLVNPFPVPPYVEAMIWLSATEPSKLLP